jgi:hypothetical protein
MRGRKEERGREEEMEKAVLLQNGGFFNTCTMKRCLHSKVDFKTNALNKAHVLKLLHHKAKRLQNDGIIIYLQIITNLL